MFFYSHSFFLFIPYLQYPFKGNCKFFYSRLFYYHSEYYLLITLSIVLFDNLIVHSMSSSNIPSLSSTLTLVLQICNLGFALVFLIFGSTGCFLNILLFSRRQFRTVSCCTCKLALSVVKSHMLKKIVFPT